MLTIAAVREVTEHIGASGRSHLRPLIDFRAGFHRLLWRRADALFAHRRDAVRAEAGALVGERHGREFSCF